MTLQSTSWTTPLSVIRMLMSSLMMGFALLLSTGTKLSAQTTTDESIHLVASAAREWVITVEADTEVWADWNANGQKDEGETLTSGQEVRQSTSGAELSLFGAVKKLIADNNDINEVDLSSATSLTEISLAHNNLEDFDSSDSEALIVANISYNQCESLDFSYNEQLQELDCSYNPSLSSIDLPSQLQQLQCSNCAFSSLSIQSLSSLTLLDCSANPIQMIDFSQCGALQYLYLRDLDQIPYYAGGLQISNLSNLVELDFSGSTYTYVECPTSETLKKFNCSRTKLDIFNVAGFPNLEELNARGSMILTLDLSANNKLTKLICDSTQLKKVTMPTEPQLEYIAIQSNRLQLDGVKSLVTALNDRTGTTAGTIILVNSNDKYEGNLYDDETLHAFIDKNWNTYDYMNGDNDGLNPLRPSDMPLSPYTTDQPKIVLTSDATSGDWDLQIEVKSDDDKKSVWIDRNENGAYDEGEEITTFNRSIHFPHSAKVITIYGKIQNLFCYMNSLTAIDLTDCPELEILDAANNKLSTIDLSKNSQLRALTLHRNNLTTIDVSKSPHLFRLYFNYNKISQIDLSKNLDIVQLMCKGNELQTLDVTMLTQLKYFDCSGNKLSQLDLSHSEDLTNLLCSDNLLTALELSAATELLELTCMNNQIATSIDFSKSVALKEISLYNNRLERETMLQTIQSLPSKPEGAFYGIDTSLEPKDGNVITKSAVKLLTNKGWLCYDFRGGENAGKNLYEGSIDVSTCNPLETEQIRYASDTEVLLIPASYQSIELYDTAGRRLLSVDAAPSISLATLPRGVYVVRADSLTSADVTTFTFIKE